MSTAARCSRRKCDAERRKHARPAQKLVKQSGELCDEADVLMREAEAAVAALRAAMKQSAFEALPQVIRSRLRDGRLPHDDIPATIPGRPGDDLPLVAPHAATPIRLHADCFELWSEERRTPKPSS